MNSRKTSSSVTLTAALVGAALTLLAGCPDNGAKPGATPAASGTAAPTTNTNTAPAATPAAPAKTGSGW